MMNQSEEAWAPVWKALEESPQFQCGMLHPYLRIEESIKDDDFTVAPYNNPHNHNIRRFLKQVRETRGFDLDNCPKEFLKEGFPLRATHHNTMMQDDGYRRVFRQKISFLLAQINAQAKMHGKKYELVEVTKVVDAMAHRLTLVTLTLNQGALAPEEAEVEAGAETEAGHQVKKVVQAMVFNACGGNYKLQDWRFKPPQPQDHTSASST